MTEKQNIILDLGGVILDIDYHRTISAFHTVGIKDAQLFYSQQFQVSLFDQLEKGMISENDFYDAVRLFSGKELSNEVIEKCWNALLIGLPQENIRTLFELKKKYRLFLLSNTNSIHEKAYRRMIVQQHGDFIFDAIFEKMYLSHHLHLRKPEQAIFEYVLHDANLVKSETIFIDDSIQHVAGAKAVGLHALLFPKDKLLGAFLEKETIL